MNAQYLDPNYAPWTEEYRESYGCRLKDDDHSDQSSYVPDDNADGFWDGYQRLLQ